MKFSSTILLITALFLSNAHAWNEPDGFMGIRFWQPITASIKECPLDSYFGETPEYRYYDPSKTKDPCFENQKGSSTFSVRNIGLTVWALDVTAYTLDKKVSHLVIDFHRNAYQTVVLTFKERYGSPTSSHVEKWRSKMGATFNNQIMNWEGRRLSIALTQIGLQVDHGFITYDTTEWQAESARKAKDEIKKAAKGL